MHLLVGLRNFAGSTKLLETSLPDPCKLDLTWRPYHKATIRQKLLCYMLEYCYWIIEVSKAGIEDLNIE